MVETLRNAAGEAIDPARIIRTIAYAHPVYTAAGRAAQRRYEEIGGRGRTHYCGAYWGWGFHEDGVASARVGFADGADVRYTADARVWCGICLGLLDARDTVKRGLMTKEGGQSLARYFHQIGEPPGRKAAANATTRRSRP